jgi:OPA family glycerol-3-phosphate transporter-like MFS transporter
MLATPLIARARKSGQFLISRIRKPEPFWFVCILSWFVYILTYLGRINFSIALPYLQREYGYSKASLGLVASGFFITYAVSQFINGILGDRFSPRYFIFIGLLASALQNIVFCFSKNITIMLVLWSLNGYFQAMLWGPLLLNISLLSPRKGLQGAMMFMSSSPIAGYFLSYLLVGNITVSYGWKAAFFLPGVLLSGGALLWFALLPVLNAAASRRMEKSGDEEKEESNSASALMAGQEGIWNFIFRIRLWAVAFVCILVGIVKEGLILWGPTFFSEVLSFDMAQILIILSFFPFINMLSIVLCGRVNKYFRYNEKLTLLVFLSAATAWASFLRLVVFRWYIPLILGFCGLLAAIYAVNNILVAFVPVKFSRERRVSTAAGIIDSALYAGAAISGPLIGGAAETLFGWKGIITCWLIICGIAVMVTALFINFTGIGKTAYGK